MHVCTWEWLYSMDKQSLLQVAEYLLRIAVIKTLLCIYTHMYKDYECISQTCRCVNNKTMYTHTSESRWSMRESAGADTSLSFDESCKHWVIQFAHCTQGLPVLYVPVVVCQWHLLWSAQTVQPWPSDLVPHHYQSPSHCYTSPKTMFMKDNVTNTVNHPTHA